MAGLACLLMSIMCKVIVFVVVVAVGVFGNRNLNRVAMNIGGPTRDWRNDLISRFASVDSPLSLENNEYLSNWSGTWPGTLAGCYCTQTNGKAGVLEGVNRGECNYNQKSYGCLTVPKKDPVPLVNWTGKRETLVAVRFINSSYLELRDLKLPNGTCVTDAKKCSDFCVPQTWESCPVTGVQIKKIGDPPSDTDAQLYNQSVDIAGQFTVYWTESPQFRTVTELTVAEHKVSAGKQAWCSSPGRKQYPLLTPAEESCSVDPRFEELQEVGEKWLLDTNGVDYSQLTDFETSDSYRWKRFVGRSLQTKPECIESQLRLVTELPDRLVRLKSLDIKLSAASWVFFIFGSPFILMSACMVATHEGFHDFENNLTSLSILRVFVIVDFSFQLVGLIPMTINYFILQSLAVDVYAERLKHCFDDQVMQPYEDFKQRSFFKIAFSFFLQILCLGLSGWNFQLCALPGDDRAADDIDENGRALLRELDQLH